MEKHKGYQRILEEGEISTKNRFLYRISKRYSFLERKYWELSRPSLYKIKEIPNLSSAKKILDIGCGAGVVFEYIKKFYNEHADFYGVDLEKNEFLPEFVKFFKCDIDKGRLPFEDNTMDIVLSIFVLEHLHQPENLFSEAFRVLKPHGFFYCVTEHFSSLFLPDNMNFYQDPTHVRPWSKKAMITLGRMNKFKLFKIIKTRPVEYLFLIPFIPFAKLLHIGISFTLWEFLSGRTMAYIGRK